MAILAGTKTATVTAAALGSSQMVSYLAIQSDPGNVANVVIGSSNAQYVELTPGAALTLENVDLDDIYVKTATGTATVNYLGVE
jgi:hypothetical protein